MPDRIAEPWGERTPFGPGEPWPQRVDMELAATDWDTAMDRIVARSQELLERPGGWGRIGFYTSGQLFALALSRP